MSGPGRTYTASFLTSALTTNPHDVLTMISSTESKVKLRGLDIFPISTASSVENLGLEVFRLSSGSTSDGAALAPRPIAGHAQHPAAVTTVTANSSTLLSTASAHLMFAGAVTPDGFHYAPPECCEIQISDIPQRLWARITAPSTVASLRLAVTATFQEIGQVPGL